jgi:chitodextrinase
LTGPSELARSVGLLVLPDVVTRNGIDQSTIFVTVREAGGEPAVGVSVRLDMDLDFGMLAPRTIYTGADGRAIAVYTAPPPPPPGSPNAANTLTIRATPIGSDYQTALGRTARIQVVPQTMLAADSPIPQFTYSPTSPSEGQRVSFDASASTAAPGRTIVGYQWNWGDGEVEFGIAEEHDWTVAGDYFVVLTVTDDAGVSASSTQLIRIAAAAGGGGGDECE